MKTAVAALAISIAPLSALAADVTVETATGSTSVAQSPQTVIALDLAAIDAFDALGIKVDGVPQINPPAHLASAVEGVPTVGSLFEPDFEAIAVMQPDLIVAGGRSQRQVGPLSEIAPTIDMTIWEDAVAQGRDRVTAYGAIFDMEEKAAEVLATFDAALANAKAAVDGKGDALILLTNGGKVSAYGDDSRFGWLHTGIGIPEAFEEITAETHGESVSFEFIAEVNPDWIIVIDRAAAIGQDGEAAAVTLDNPLVAGTTAGETGQIIYIDSAAIYLSSGGIQSMQLLVNQIAHAFAGGES